MNPRKNQLLKLVVENFINTAEPVGSKFLVEKSDLGVSGATVRNEMRDMENQGFLTHPHTSAGRIPTEQGYKYYIDNLMKPVSLDKKIKNNLEEILNNDIERDILKIKIIGKYVAEYTKSAIIIAFGEDNIYYTGISNLFSQPEFKNYAHVVSFSTIFDQCEDRIDDILECVKPDNTSVMIGQENPLGNACSLLSSKIKDNILFSILGPMRMDYAINIGLLNHIRKIV
jgi:heat-inducible transcriptional repressor